MGEILRDESDIFQKSSDDLDVELSELEFEILFLKCQVLADSSPGELSILSDVNDEVAAMECKVSEIEAELKKRGDTSYERKPFAYTEPVTIRALLRALPKTRAH
jgi:hypothetical protein